MELKKVFEAQRICLVGASNKAGSLGLVVSENLLSGPRETDLTFVSMDGEEDVAGRPCKTELNSGAGPFDLSLVAVPVARLKEAVAEALSARVHHLAVLTSIDRELGGDMDALREDILGMCQEKGVRLLGPGSLGLADIRTGLNATYFHGELKAGGVAVISRSSALAAAMLDWAAHRGLGLARIVSLGDMLDLDEADFFEIFAEDDDLRVVIGYLENIRSGKEFVKRAEALSSVKPVVLLKAGTTAAGEKAALLHTGRKLHSDIAYGAAFKRSGVILAENFQELFDFARVFDSQPMPQGRRVAVLSNAGAAGILSADAVEGAGLTLARLGESTLAAIKRFLPGGAQVDNPVDLLGSADPKRFAAAFEAVQSDEDVDAVLMVHTPHLLAKAEETVEALVKARVGEKPALAVFMGGASVVQARQRLVDAGIPDYPSPGRAVAALGALCDYAVWRKRPPRIVARFPVNRRRVERVLRRHQRLKRLEVEEYQAKEILAAYDFTVPEGQLAEDADGAIEAAERVGYPVAMKIVSPDIVHKSGLGGVRLRLASPEAVRDAYDLIMLRIQRKKPEALIEGVYVEKMCQRGIEVVIGMHRDAQFGPMLMFGLGGIAVEVMDDATFHLAPITFDEAMQMLESTRAFTQLSASALADTMDPSAIAQGLQKISQLAGDFPQIQELEIHPFIVGRPGTEPIAADVRILMNKGDTA